MSRASSTDPARFVQPGLRELGAYTLHQVPFRHKLDQNEVPWDLPVRLKREIARRLLERNWAHYPDFHGDRLRALLGELHGWPSEGVLVGNGSNELLGLLLESIVGPGSEVVGALPSFGLYEMFVRRAGGRTGFLPPRADLRLPMAELVDEVERDPSRPVLLCSPNNPTGAAATPEEVESLLERLEAPLLLDNAYGEFCRHDYRPLLARHRHLVLLRTFSKAWSLAGLRLGYLIADPALVHELIKVKLPYNLGHATAIAGEVAVEHQSVAERAVRLIVGRRGQWLEMLGSFADRELEVFESEGNFLLVRHPIADEVRAELGRRGILVRAMSHYPGLAGCFRIAVGSGPALRDTAAALAEILPALPSEPAESQAHSQADSVEDDALAATVAGPAKAGRKETRT